MPEEKEVQKSWLKKLVASVTRHLRLEHIHIGPFVTTAKTKFGRFLQLFLLLMVALAVLIVPNLKHLIAGRAVPPLLKSGPIEVFLPDPSKYGDGAFYQDGAVQKRGFEKAIDDTQGLPTKLDVEFQAMRQEDTPAELLAKMKKLYEAKEATFFLMTMSGKAEKLRDYFVAWHKECVEHDRRAPILIITVASAPELANASGGILRWYIRSDEEDAIIAAYMRWKLAVTDAAVFFITRHAGQEDDPYGKNGRDLFQDRFTKLQGLQIQTFAVTAATAKDQVSKFLQQYHKAPSEAHRKAGALVIGYGDTFRETITALIDQGFDGPIMCTSTLTEPEWQPKSTNADGRIFTVLPRLKGVPGTLEGDDKNVVFFFAKDTLFHILELTAIDSDSRMFVRRWQARKESHLLDHDFLANGDAIVRVDVVGADKWR